ncbi:MAG: hypothetical protein BACD_02654 [Bacteroides rodentium]
MKMSLTKKGLAAAFAALGMFSLISTVHAQTEPYYAGAASADISTGRVTGTLDQLCDVIVKDYYTIIYPVPTMRVVEAKFNNFHRGKNGDSSRLISCYIKSQRLTNVGNGQLEWLPVDPAWPDIATSPFGPVMCNEYNGTGLYGGRDGCWYPAQ